MHKISIEEAKKISEIRNTIKDKKEDKRLHAIQLRGQGKSNKEIAEKLDTSIKVVNNWICKYVKEGIEGLLSKGQKGNHRNLTFEQEEEMLKKFEEKGKKGQII
ncbi:homeodomain-like domain protein, partial [Peptoanaerobacter stomatis]